MGTRSSNKQDGSTNRFKEIKILTSLERCSGVEYIKGAEKMYRLWPFGIEECDGCR